MSVFMKEFALAARQTPRLYFAPTVIVALALVEAVKKISKVYGEATRELSTPVE